MAIKGDSVFENTKGGTIELLILEALLKGENVVIPDLGHLELKTLGDRRTVLFKPDDNNDSFLKVASTTEAQDKKEAKVLYNTITIPLKEEKTVNLPQVGLFRPKKRENGEIYIDFTPSASLRNLLNNTEVKSIKIETEKTEAANELNEIKKEEDKIKDTSDIQEDKGGIEKDNVIVNKISNTEKGSNDKIEVNELSTSKTNDIASKFKNNNLKSAQTAPTKTIEMQGETKKPAKRKSISGVLLVIAIIVFILVIAIFSITSRHNKDEQAKLAATNVKTSEFISLPSLAEQHYGNSAFWIYIYEANLDKLKSPINIPKNTLLVIPDLKSEYDVDISDSMEIQRANIKADIILKKENNN